MCTYLRWPILYTFLILVTYSVHEEYFDGITLHELVFAHVTFMAYFAYLLFLGKFISTYFMATRAYLSTNMFMT